jgi:predicted phosphodiesterase
MPDIVVENGDFIEGTGRKGEKSEFDWLELQSKFLNLKMPFLHVIGNHETRGMTRDRWKELTGNNNTYYTFDVDRMRVIVLDGNQKGRESENKDAYYEEEENEDEDENEEEEEDDKNKEEESIYKMRSEQLIWLEKILRNTKNYKIVVFIHYPLSSYAYPSDSKRLSPIQSETLKKLFSKYNVAAVFSGHVEKLYYEKIDGVNYFVLPGIRKSKNKNVLWLDCYYEIVIKNNNVKTKMYYKKNENDTEYKELLIPSEEYEFIEK